MPATHCSGRETAEDEDPGNDVQRLFAVLTAAALALTMAAPAAAVPTPATYSITSRAFWVRVDDGLYLQLRAMTIERLPSGERETLYSALVDVTGNGKGDYALGTPKKMEYRERPTRDKFTFTFSTRTVDGGGMIRGSVVFTVDELQRRVVPSAHGAAVHNGSSASRTTARAVWDMPADVSGTITAPRKGKVTLDGICEDGETECGGAMSRWTGTVVPLP